MGTGLAEDEALKAGETITCTFAWPVDPDCIDDAYLSFFHGAEDKPYLLVKAVP